MPRQYSMDNRSVASAATRARLLDAAVDVLAEVGGAALTMQMVADTADVALRTVYNHFPSKEVLVVAAYQRLADATQVAVSTLPESGAPRERLGRFVVAFYDTFDEQSPGAAAILGVTGVPEFDEQVNAVRAWRRKELTTILRAGERDGSLQLPLKQAVAVAFLWTSYATWHSLSIESKLGPAATRDVALRALDRTLFEAHPA